MDGFAIDPRIRGDCHCLGQWGRCWLMLNRDSSVRWLILVPETEVSEWHELPPPLRDELLEAAASLGAMLKEELGCDKVNSAAIGNLVPQFHFHLIGRWRSDPYWPGVVWGQPRQGRDYTPGEVDAIKRSCFDRLKSAGGC